MVSPLWADVRRCAECVPACIVGVKVTSHIGRKTTGGDLFLTICDYGWKPLCTGCGLCGEGLEQIQMGGGLSGCGAGKADRTCFGGGARAGVTRFPAPRVRAGNRSVIGGLRRRFPCRSHAVPEPADPASAHAIRRRG
ncbi:hypothetical protein DIE14_11180 [Burkholderia sp. Bp9017]|nr:hypothetical protein DIE14_11180 [Burkholderia sp. Bp9017]RQZ35574.1 hypothetical protein DIE13_09770 [Burkholderia sp. Bp9016]